MVQGQFPQIRSSVLVETQKDRDTELGEYLSLSMDKVRSYRMESRLGPPIHTGGDLRAKTFNHLYARLRTAALPKVLRAFLMFITEKRGELVIRANKMLGNVKERRILDFGCGVGSHGIHFLHQGAKVDFLDVKGPVYEFAQWRVKNRGLGKNARFLYPETDLEKRAYDVLLCIDVMEHVADPMAEFERVTAATKVGGFIVLQVGMKLNPQQGHFEQSREIWLSGKCRSLRKRRLREIEKFYFVRR